MDSISTEAISRIPIDVFLDAVQTAFLALADGRLLNPPRRETMGRPDDPDYFRLEMPAMLHDADGRPRMVGVKVIEELGAEDTGGARALGQRIANVTLRHPDTGRTALIEADWMTDTRTGAAAAWAIRSLTSRVESLGLIGTGRIATACARAADALLAPGEIVAHSRTAERRETFAKLDGELRTTLRCEADPAALADCDAVIAAVPAPAPVLTELHAGARCLISIEGDPRAVLVDPALLARGPVLADEWIQARRSGSLVGGAAVTPATVDDRPATVADAVAGRLGPLRDAGAIVLMTGLGAVDLCCGWAVWIRAGGPT